MNPWIEAVIGSTFVATIFTLVRVEIMFRRSEEAREKRILQTFFANLVIGKALLNKDASATELLAAAAEVTLNLKEQQRDE